MLDLLKTIGVDHVCIGVESGNPGVFDAIHKGEFLEEIIAAAHLIKGKGLRLYTCFIVGLPEATAAAERDSIRLARVAQAGLDLLEHVSTPESDGRSDLVRRPRPGVR